MHNFGRFVQAFPFPPISVFFYNAISLLFLDGVYQMAFTQLDFDFPI